MQMETDPLEYQIRGDLENHNAEKHQLIAQVDGVLVHVYVLCEAVRERRSKVHAVKLEDKEA